MRQDLSQFEQRMIAKIGEFGWFALSVAPAAESDDPQEWFTYTIGLPHTYGWPELICFGLDGPTAHNLIHETIEWCREKGESPTDQMLLTGYSDGESAKFIDAAGVSDSYFNSANWFARFSGLADPVRRLQILWHDKNGAFPDQPECDEVVKSAQTPVEVE